MKNCIKCTSPLNDNDKYCSICGAEQRIERTISHNFCARCGAPINHNNKFCPQCGSPIQIQQTQQNFKIIIPPIIKSLSDRITLSAVLWIIIASVQLLFGFVLLCAVSLTSDWEIDYIISLIVYFLFGGLNLREGIKLLKYKKTILTDFVGIVWENRICFESCASYLWNAYVVFNGFVAGDCFSLMFAFLGASVIIVDFVTIKLFVKNNKESFLHLEKSQSCED